MTNPYDQNWSSSPQMPPTGPQYPYAPPAPPQKPKWSTGKKVGVGAAVLAVLVIGANAGGDDDDDSDDSLGTTTTSVQVAPIVDAPPVQTGPKTTFGNGMYLVGTQVEAGTYQAPGGSNCYYERRSDTAADLNGIIANEWSPDNSQQIVTIDPSDVAFKTKGCGTWTKIG